MKQQTLTGFKKYGKTTRRAQFLADMDQIIPWPERAAVNDHLRRSGIKITRGTMVDATIIGASSSTNNQVGKRDPEMHQTTKGQQWYLGMRAQVGVASRTKLVHTVLATATNVADRDALPYLLHGHETLVWGDQGYQGQIAVIHARVPNAKDFTNRGYRYHGRINEVVKAKNRTKLRVRAKVAHVFGVIKNIFGFRKTRYRGLAKNLHRLESTDALSNLYLVRRRLLKA